MSYSLSDIGARIASMRNERGISQDELAKKLNVSREVVAKWESGTRDLKTQYTISLADYFGVSCDEILRGVKADNIDVNARTGLSDKSVETLESRFKNDRHSRDVLNYLIETEKMEWFCFQILSKIELEIDYFNRKKASKHPRTVNNQQLNIQITEASGICEQAKETSKISVGEFREFRKFQIVNELQKIIDSAYEYFFSKYQLEESKMEHNANDESM